MSLMTSSRIINQRLYIHVFLLFIPTVLTFYVYLISNVSIHTPLKSEYMNEYLRRKIGEINRDVTRNLSNYIGHENDTLGVPHSDYDKSILGVLFSPFGLENHTYTLNLSKDTLYYLEKFKSCADFINISQPDIVKAESLINNMNIQSYSPADYINMTKDCHDFTINRRYIMKNLTKEETDFPIAYSILMYKDIEQFERLLRAIYRPQNCYCVHVDLKANTTMFNAVESISGCFSNVYLAPKRVSVRWGKITVLEPELICMKFLYEQCKLWKYFINLTGQEFPLKTNFELVKILTAYDGANDIMTFKRSKRDLMRWERKGNPPHNITAFKGAVHIVASRRFVEYINYNRIAHDFLDWVNGTGIPDETFFSTLNHNPYLGISGSFTGVIRRRRHKDSLSRYKHWRLDGYLCNGIFVRNICIFGIGSLPVLTKSMALFANKFFWSPSSRVAFECMEEIIHNRTWDNYYSGKTDLDIQFYETQSFVRERVP